MQTKTFDNKYHITYHEETGEIVTIKRYTENTPGLRREKGVKNIFKTYLEATTPKTAHVTIDKTNSDKHVLTDTKNGIIAMYKPNEEYKADIYVHGELLPENKVNLINMIFYDILATMGDY